MAYLDRIRSCNAYDLSGFRPFLADGRAVGWVRPALAERLAGFRDVFQVAAGKIEFAPGLAGRAARAARDAALAEVAAQLASEGLIPALRSELYPAAPWFGAPPAFVIDRAAVPAFGMRAFGVHMNGFVRRADGLHMWIGRRAADKSTYPGMLDNMVAGGQPHGLPVSENLIKECAEEAAIPEKLARRAVPVGAITYCMEAPEGLKPDVQFCFDLELPADFVPRNTDGEIAEFYLWPIDRVAETVRETEAFKFNCNLVIIDFLIRHGYLGPEDPDYLAIVGGLRMPAPAA